MLRTVISIAAVAALVLGGAWAWFSLDSLHTDQVRVESFFADGTGVLVSSTSARASAVAPHLRELGYELNPDLEELLELLGESGRMVPVHVQTDGEHYVVAVMDDVDEWSNVLQGDRWKVEEQMGFFIIGTGWTGREPFTGELAAPASGLSVSLDGQRYEVLPVDGKGKFFTAYTPSDNMKGLANRMPTILDWRLSSSTPYLYLGIRDPFGLARDWDSSAMDQTQIAWIGQEMMFQRVGRGEVCLISTNSTMDAARLLEEYTQPDQVTQIGDVPVLRLRKGHAMEIFFPEADSGVYYCNYQGMVLGASEPGSLEQVVAAYNSGNRMGTSDVLEKTLVQWMHLDSLAWGDRIRGWMPALPNSLFGEGGRIIRNGQRWFLSGLLRKTETSNEVVVNKSLKRRWSLGWENGGKVQVKAFRIPDHLNGGRGFLIVQGTQAKYLDRNGKLRWERTLSSPMVGEPQVVDLFQNRKNQFLLTTSGEIHLWDLKGRDVEGFPIQVKGRLTAAASFVRYPDQKSPRIIAGTRNGSWLCFDGAGKKVQGWESHKASAAVVEPIRWVSFAGKDYLVSMDARGQIYALNRRGQNRVNNLPRSTADGIVEFEKGSDVLSCRFSYRKDAYIHHDYLSGQRDSFALELPQNAYHPRGEQHVWGSNEHKLALQDGLGLIQMEWDIPVAHAMQPSLVSEKTQKVLFLTPSGEELYLLDNLGLTVSGFPIAVDGFYQLWMGREGSEFLVLEEGELGLYELKH